MNRFAAIICVFVLSALITRYALPDRDRSLMVANIHMINFDPDLSAFHDQADECSTSWRRIRAR